MKKAFLWLLLSVNGWAACPLNTYPENHKLDAEINNVCDNILNPIIAQATISSETVKYMAISSATFSGQLQMGAKKIANLANGTASTDGAAYGQIGGTSGTNSCGYVIGSIAQTVKVSDTTSITSTGTSYTSTNTAGAISPKCSTDQIFISVAGTLNSTAFSTSNSYMTIFRGTTDLETSGFGFVLLSGNAANTVMQVPSSAVYLDSPGTTNSTTYTVKIKSDTAAKATWNGNGTGTMVLLDIAG